MKRKPAQLLSLIHRALLHFWPYKKMIYWLGLDGYRYKKYYKNLSYDNDTTVNASEVDGYRGEGEFERIVRLVDILVKHVPEPRAVLDIGCGTGRYLKRMHTIWPNAYFEGIDISQAIVENFTRKQVPGIPIHVMDIEADEQYHIDNRESFDLVCLIGIIQILSQRKTKRILEKVHTLCKDNGHIYIQFNLETAEKKTSVGYKRYSIPELTILLEMHGFQVIAAKKTTILKDYAYLVAKKTSQ